MITTKLIKIQVIKEEVLLNKKTTPGKNKTNSKSKRTNKIARKKKGVLTETKVNKLSKPDSKGDKLSLFMRAFLERNTWIIRAITKTRINEMIKIIMILEFQLLIF